MRYFTAAPQPIGEVAFIVYTTSAENGTSVSRNR